MENSKPILEKIIIKFEEIDFLDQSIINNNIKQVCEELSLKFKDVGPVVRFGLTGRLKAPSIDELCFILGKDRSLERLNSLKSFIS